MINAGLILLAIFTLLYLLATTLFSFCILRLVGVQASIYSYIMLILSYFLFLSILIP